MSITIATATFRNKPLLLIEGEMVCQESIKLTKALQPFLDSSADRVFIDLSRTYFIDSYGIGGLIYSQKLLQRNGKQLILLNPHTKILTLLERNNLHHIFFIEYSASQQP